MMKAESDSEGKTSTGGPGEKNNSIRKAKKCILAEELSY
jgi:hypothetical protein